MPEMRLCIRVVQKSSVGREEMEQQKFSFAIAIAIAITVQCRRNQARIICW